MFQIAWTVGTMFGPPVAAYFMYRHVRSTLVRERVADGIARPAAEAEVRDRLRRRAWKTRAEGLVLFGCFTSITLASWAVLWTAEVNHWKPNKGLGMLLLSSIGGFMLAMFCLFEVVTGRPAFRRKWADVAARGPRAAVADRLMGGPDPAARTCSVCGTRLRWPRRGLCADCAARAG